MVHTRTHTIVHQLFKTQINYYNSINQTFIPTAMLFLIDFKDNQERLLDRVDSQYINTVC